MEGFFLEGLPQGVVVQFDELGFALAAKEKTNASVRTTTAVTQIEGGTKDNVLPAKARAIVNFRVLPRDTVEGVLANVRKVVDDERVHVEALPWTKEQARTRARSPAPPARLRQG